MTPPSRALRVLVLALLALTPGLASAHEEDGSLTPEEEQATQEEAPPNAGYTGPSRLPYLSFFQGVWVYGRVDETKLAGQLPRNVEGDGDWLVWEDANRADIYLYSVSAGDGFYLTSDGVLQRNPDISGGTVVWEDYRHGNAASIYAYRIESGETVRVTTSPGNHRRPSVDGAIVAWEDDRTRNPDVWGAWLTNLTEFPIAATNERESDPLVLDGVVYYRTYRFNVWDVIAHDPVANRTVAVTSDSQIQSTPFTNGDEVLFLTQDSIGWILQRYDPSADRLRTTTLRQRDTSPASASGEHLLVTVHDVGYAQLVARNMSSGGSNHITGNLRLVTEPLLDGHTAYLMVLTEEGVSLVRVEVSDFAFSRRPTLLVHYPLPSTLWTRPLTAQGVLRAGTQWTEPETFTYRVNDGPPRAIPAGPEWEFQLDPGDLPPGAHEITLRATFREGPPVETTFTLLVPAQSRPLDVEAAGAAYHRARIFATYNRFIGDNAAAWIILPLALAIVALVAFRVVLAIRARRVEDRIEYVRP